MKHYTKLFGSLLFLLMGVTQLSAQINLMGVSNASGLFQVLRWDALTGTISSTVQTPESLVYAGASVADAARGYYYFRGSNSLQQVSFAPDIVQALPSQVEITSGEVSMSTGKIYGLGPDITYSPSGSFQSMKVNFQEYNPVTFSDTILLHIPRVAGILGDGSAFNSNAGIYYFLGIDSTLGTCIYSIPTTGPSISFTRTPIINPLILVQSLEYDNDDNILYAIGNTYDTNGSLTNLQIHQIDVTTGIVTTEANLTSYNGYVLTSNSYDQSSHTMVVMAVSPGGAFQFIGWDTKADTLYMLQHPGGNLVEIEADNVTYASVKYQATATIAAAPQQLITAFPNPCTDRLTLLLQQADEPTHVAVYDALGTQVLSQTTNASQLDLDVSALPAGHYYVRSMAGAQVAKSHFVVAGSR